MAKNSRSYSRKNRKSNRRNTRRRQYGGYESTPASTSGNSMASMEAQSLAQGRQFAEIHKNQHGGALEAGPFPGAVVAPTILPYDLHASARVAPLDASMREISGLSDQDGGRRKSKKSRKNSKKSRKSSKKSRKNSKKSRKNSKKSKKNRKSYKGGSYSLDSAAPFNSPGLLLPAAMEAKALSGMNAEWKLAENPDAFAPGVRS